MVFQNCLILSEDEDTQEFNYVRKRNPTKSGLALALGVSPQTVVDYVKGSGRRGNIYKREGENKGRQKIATADRTMQTGIDRSRRKPGRLFQACRATKGSGLLFS